MEKKCYFMNGGEHKVAKNIAIKVARVEKDMTQKVLAEAVGVSRQTINAIEKGEYNPTIKHLLSRAHPAPNCIPEEPPRLQAYLPVLPRILSLLFSLRICRSLFRFQYFFASFQDCIGRAGCTGNSINVLRHSFFYDLGYHTFYT